MCAFVVVSRDMSHRLPGEGHGWVTRDTGPGALTEGLAAWAEPLACFFNPQEIMSHRFNSMVLQAAYDAKSS